jgi:hypothetical protein
MLTSAFFTALKRTLNAVRSECARERIRLFTLQQIRKHLAAASNLPHTRIAQEKKDDRQSARVSANAATRAEVAAALAGLARWQSLQANGSGMEGAS